MDPLTETLEVGQNGHAPAAPRVIVGTSPLRLNLGAGDSVISGYINLDIKTGQDIRKLPYADASVEEVYASHVLEHFGLGEVQDILKEWSRVIKPGGRLRVAVPDAEWWAKRLLAGTGAPPQILMGGQTDEYDFHKCVFNADGLALLLQRAGLSAIQRFNSFAPDCSSLECSLNLEGRKPLPVKRNIRAVLSVPDLLHSDSSKCAWEILGALNIPMHMVTGVFWGQCLERAITEEVENGAEWILTLDYDTIITPQMFDRLCTLFELYPDVDALAPLHPKRGPSAQPLFKPLPNPPGVPGIPMKDNSPAELIPAEWSHFGLTLFRGEKFKKLTHPWFKGEPNDKGRWDDGKIDDDIYFWKKWQEAGNNLFIASRVPLGHTQRMVTWLDDEFNPIHQHLTEFWKHGMPAGVRW